LEVNLFKRRNVIHEEYPNIYRFQNPNPNPKKRNFPERKNLNQKQKNNLFQIYI